MRYRTGVPPLLLLLLGACTENAQTPVSFDLRARGGPIEAALGDGTELTVSKAEFAFGPFYLCAGAQAGQSCDTALMEWRESRVVDLAAATPVTLGRLEGYSGRALSYMHDCGIVSLLTQEEPKVLGAAEDLGGHSLLLEGVAEIPVAGAPNVPFSMALRIATWSEAERGEPVVRSSPGQFDASIDAETSSLTVGFDASAWLGALDASTFWQDAACADGEPGVVCAGTLSQDCTAEVNTDCAESNQICAPNLGCRDAVVLGDDSAAGRAVAQAITLAEGVELQVE